MDAFLNANISKNKDLTEWNDRRSAMIKTWSSIFLGIRFSQIFVSEATCILTNVHHDVLGILVRSESVVGVYVFHERRVLRVYKEFDFYKHVYYAYILRCYIY